MLKVVLSDGTIINNCTDATTVDRVYILRNNCEAAGAVLDIITPEKVSVLRIYNENDELIRTATNRILLDDVDLDITDDGTVASFGTRVKTDLEIMHDEIAELQEAIIGG